MGQYLTKIHSEHNAIKRLNNIPCQQVRVLCQRWKSLGIPFYMTPNEFTKNLIQGDDINLNYEKISEIEVLEYLTALLIISIGPQEEKLDSEFYLALFELYQFEHEDFMTGEELYVCLDKCCRSICEEGLIQLPYIEQDTLEEFVESLCAPSNSISKPDFQKAVSNECEVFSTIFQENSNFLRTLSTHIIENPFTIIPYLQPGNLFLGKYEIIHPPIVIETISSIYKRKYKHAILDVKPMIGGEGNLRFELIYLTGVNGDKSFRQNYFREIVLKNKLTKEEVHEFGELPGGILYKRITELEETQMTLREYLQKKTEETKGLFAKSKGRRKLVCLSETETINLGLKLLDQLEILHNMHVKHSNINPSSVYLIKEDVQRLCFLDLELAIWNPFKILGTDSPYFQQLSGDKYDTTFRDEDYLSPEHKTLAEEYRKTGKIPEQGITKACDLYSIGAIMYKALTGESPVDFSHHTAQYQNINDDRDLLEDWECPKELNDLAISNEMAIFLIQILHSDMNERLNTISKVKARLDSLQVQLSTIPKRMLKGLGHIPNNKPEMFEDEFLFNFRKYSINDFCLEYLYKFIVESDIPKVSLFGDAELQIRALRQNTIQDLLLPNKSIFAEELKLLSFFIAINSSLTAIDLSKNLILNRHRPDLVENDVKSKEDGIQLSSIGFDYFIKALENHTNLRKFELAQVNLGPEHAKELCGPISQNMFLERLNLAGCELHKKGVKSICKMAESMAHLEYINLSSNRIGDEGACCVAKLLEKNHNILEIDLFRNNIQKRGGEAIGLALTNNFIIQKLSIGDNQIDEDEKNLILQSVMFNTQYKKLKATNERFGEFGYNLMAESIKRWIEKSNFVLKKLEARLHQCEDDIDKKLAELLLDEGGSLNLNISTNQLPAGI